MLQTAMWFSLSSQPLVSGTNPGILSRRYFLVQKAKEARTVGILVGTLGAGKCSSFCSVCCVCAQCIVPSLLFC